MKNAPSTPLPEASPKELARFMRKLIKLPADGCWLWQAGKNGKGYGSFDFRRKTVAAHRFSYWMLRGHFDPALQIDHLCRNPACVNPDHLQPVPAKTNTHRGVGLTAQNARKTHCHRGHAFTPETTYLPPRGGRQCRLCWPIYATKYRQKIAAGLLPSTDEGRG